MQPNLFELRPPGKHGPKRGLNVWQQLLAAHCSQTRSDADSLQSLRFRHDSVPAHHGFDYLMVC